MTQKQILEMVKLHHPDMSDAQARIHLNKALDEFCEQTKILKGQATLTGMVIALISISLLILIELILMIIKYLGCKIRQRNTRVNHADII